MKKLNRLPKPKEYNLDKLQNYIDLKDNKNKIRDRWTNKSLGNTKLKEVLLNMSHGECCYCGKGLDEWDIEHYLPKEPFNYLSYCYDNMLPSCKGCNQNLKKNKYPDSLENNKNLGEIYLINKIPGISISLYNKTNILNGASDRIVDPSFDNPEDHIIFNPETCEYSSLTPIGDATYKMFFIERKMYTKKMQELSNHIMNLIIEKTPENIILDLNKLVGYSYHCKKLYAYWKEIFGDDEE